MIKRQPGFLRVQLLGRFLRWERVGPADDPYLTRLILGRLRIHKFHRGDHDTFHDHPFDFWTLPLRSYREEVLERTSWYSAQLAAAFSNYSRARGEERVIAHPAWYVFSHTVTAWRWHYRPSSYRHRLPDDQRWPVWTIVWTRPSGRGWGYWFFDKEAREARFEEATDG